MKFGEKSLIVLVLMGLITVSSPAFSESLFTAGVSQSYYNQPRSLYNNARASVIGDLVTIKVEETIVAKDNLKFNLAKSSKIRDSFSSFINHFLPEHWTIPSELDGFGGGQDVENSVNTDRTVTYKDTVTAQVMQVLPNGNLIVQGKKAAINAGEKVNLVVSGIVDPRFLARDGSIASNQVANFQIAFIGEGTVSKSNNEGLINKFARFLF